MAVAAHEAIEGTMEMSMRYIWEEWTLDREAELLSRDGRAIRVSRKVFGCISHLIAHRERVVGHDELARWLWGHDKISHHQLSQVVLAARGLLGDDGQSQRFIRTVVGKGYHWVAPVIEVDDTHSGDAIDRRHEALVKSVKPQSTITETSAVSPAPATQSHAPPSGLGESRTEPPILALPGPSPAPSARWRRLASAAVVACAMVMMVAFGPEHRGPTASAVDLGTAADSAIFESLHKMLLMGRYDEAREALAALPPSLAEHREARLIAIDLDIQRGRFDRAGTKLDLQFKTAETSTDPTFRAELLLRRSTLNSRRQASGAEVFMPADAAVEILRSQPRSRRPTLLAEALRARANGYNLTDRPEAALRDIAEALDIYERDGDSHHVAIVRASRARTWMRMGRTTDALEELNEVVDVFRQVEDKVREIMAYNTMSKIQIESLHWQDAVASTDRAIVLLREMPDSDRRYPTMQLRAMAMAGMGRLREAASLLEEAEAINGQRRNGIIPAMYHLEVGQPMGALEVASKDFHTSRIDTRSNLVLENREGALLLWVMAVQALAERGGTVPSPSAAQRAMLKSPTNPVARIAHGRWLLLQGEEEAAERQLRLSLQEARTLNQRLRMILAAEPLVDIALRREDVASARQIVDDVYGYEPEAMDGDYRFGLLRLRVALADDDFPAIEAAYRKVRALAGERKLPSRLDSLYAERRAEGAGQGRSGSITLGGR